MEQSQSSGGSSSINRIYGEVEGPLCRCGRVTEKTKAWTNENPGRRFYKCAAHGFYIWSDKEKPHGWQKESLLEARDQIRRQYQEIQALKESIRSLNEKIVTGEVGKSDSTVVEGNVWNRISEEKVKLENEVMSSKEREKMLRQFVVLSWGGFIVVTAMILTMVKK